MKLRAAVLLLLLPIHLTAADKWTTVRSANFTLVGNATEGQIRNVAAEFEQFRDALVQVLSITPRPPTISTTVVVFKNDESFRPFGKSDFLQVSEDINYMAVVAGSPIPRQLYQQYAHELLRDLPGPVPDTNTLMADVERSQSRAIPLKNSIDKSIKARALSDAEAEFYSGDLLLHSGNINEAGTHLQQAIKLDPKLAAAHAAMGMLYFREDRFQEALDSLKRSIELDPKNYLSEYYYAYVLDKDSTIPLDDLDAKRGALGKAIELMPQYAPAYELLAYINLAADVDYDKTVELLRDAEKNASSNPHIRLLYAQALVKKRDLDDADKILQLMAADTRLDASTKDGVQNLLDLISRMRKADAAAPVPVEPEPQPQPQPLPQTMPSPTAATPRPKSGELIAVNPQKPKPEGPQVKGMLTLVDCRAGLTLTVKSGSDTLVLHSNTPDKIQFVSYVASVSTSISCGPTPGAGIPVVITYRPTPGASSAGEPLVVEFIEK